MLIWTPYASRNVWGHSDLCISFHKSWFACFGSDAFFPSLFCCSFGMFGGLLRPWCNDVAVLLKCSVSSIYVVAIVALVTLFFLLLSPLHLWRGVLLVAFRFASGACVSSQVRACVMFWFISTFN